MAKRVLIRDLETKITEMEIVLEEKHAKIHSLENDIEALKVAHDESLKRYYQAIEKARQEGRMEVEAEMTRMQASLHSATQTASEAIVELEEYRNAYLQQCEIVAKESRRLRLKPYTGAGKGISGSRTTREEVGASGA